THLIYDSPSRRSSYLRAQAIGFELLITPIAADDGGTRIVGKTGQIAATGKHADRGRADIRERRLALLTDRVASCNVPDLVTQHCRELGLRIEKGHDAARDVDEPAAGREGVDVLAIENGELVLEIGPMTHLGRTLAHFVDVLL